MDDIQILKEMEKEQYEDAAEIKEAAGNDREISAETTQNRSKAGMLFIALGIVGLLVMQTSEPWNFWWLIFFAKPFLFGFGMHKSKWGMWGWGMWGWGMCGTHQHSGGQA